MRTRNVLIALLAVGMFSIPALGQNGPCAHYSDRSAFAADNVLDGKFNKGIEDFEEAVGTGGFKQPLPAPLQGNVPNMVGAIGFPTGLTTKNLIIQDNITPGPSPPAPNPSGDPQALFVLGAGFEQANSKKVGEDIEVLNLAGGEASLDLIFTQPNHTGVGFDLSQFANFGPPGDWTITVYNKAGMIIGTAQVPATTEPSKTFYGVWCIETIGRINIYDDGHIPDAIDNIEMWEDLPGGACCDKTGNCTEGTEADCVAAGGTYQGDGTDCGSTDCPRIIPATTEWGMVVLALIGLAVGTILFTRRRTAKA